jgi:hypothetical protein
MLDTGRLAYYCLFHTVSGVKHNCIKGISRRACALSHETDFLQECETLSIYHTSIFPFVLILDQRTWVLEGECVPISYGVVIRTVLYIK